MAAVNGNNHTERTRKNLWWAAKTDPNETLVTNLEHEPYLEFSLFWHTCLTQTFQKMIHISLQSKRPAFGYKSQPA